MLFRSVSSADPMKGAPVVLDIADPTAVNSDIVACSIDGFKILFTPGRSEERRVGKECRYRWSAYH